MLKTRILFLVISLLMAARPFSQLNVFKTTENQVIQQRPTEEKIPGPARKIFSDNYISKAGLFIVHQYHDSVFFELPASILNRDIEVINRLEQGPGGSGVYSGEELDEKTIRFEWHREDSTIQLRYTYVVSSADSGTAIYKSVIKSNLNPVVISFPVKTGNAGSQSYIIDVSRWLKDPRNFMNTLDPHIPLAKTINPGSQRDFTLEKVHAYPINVEFTISRNADTKTSASNPVAQPVSLVTHSSFILLPEKPMMQKLADERVGYFADQVWHYTDDQQKTEDRRFIVRWRLEPREEDREKYRKGELVEPEKPIVIYIDPATPKQWRPYLIAGINDWQKAFEKAGFKNAIQGREWPEEDSTMQMDDARYSFINYLPSEISNAYGPQIHDPRSGEIIQTRIGWYHNVMQLLHDWYMVQASATDPKARHVKFEEVLMGQLIRFVSSHEVGHTLGLRHNMGASSTVPVDSLRSKRFLWLHGHTPSIMDYARFDYVAQPEDSIPSQYLLPGIGEYDRWAVEWGYRISGENDPERDEFVSRQKVTDSLSANKRLWFGADDAETRRTDPRCQSEDLGDDAILASIYGIKNLKRIVPHLREWTREEGGDYASLTSIYKAVQDQFYRYMQHVMMNVGGVYTTNKSQSDKGVVVELTKLSKQKAAVSFFNTELFTTPEWMINPEITSFVAENTQPDFIQDLQIKALNKLLEIKKLNQLISNQQKFPSQAYRLDEYVNAIHVGIWKELKQTNPVADSYRRNLQKAYIGSARNILLSADADYTETDAFSVIKMDLRQLEREIAAAIPRTRDRLTAYHFTDILERIRKTLDAGYMVQ